ncbi:MAG: hypothetical protein AYP45_01770 [Candidatus Brocadia carolinensis]|uniref:Uncharacterized protein n=1 Tax=Candidatus Brocadia carolinensis TaxID=1004156 RepID=A0A1V4AX66_9BACT|nr:MAG: hypothetical protein AYP45_01770 [Candidatus Brocadia caroliniensis]
MRYNIKKFLTIDFWAGEKDSPAPLRLLHRMVKFCVLVVNEFTEGQCLLKASALTFISLVSLIPLLAFLLSVSKGLGAEKALEQKIDAYIFNLPGGEIVSSFVNFKRGLFREIDNLDFSEPVAQKKILSEIEAFDGHVLSSEEKKTFCRARSIKIYHE